MGQKSRAKKQNRGKKPINAAQLKPQEAAVSGIKSVGSGISMQGALQAAPVKKAVTMIDAGLYVRSDVRRILILLVIVFVALVALTITNNQTNFVTQGGQHLSSFLRF